MKTVTKIVIFAAALISVAGLIIWQFFLSNSVNYYIVSVCVLALSMLPFFVSFERKKITAREITLVATMIALAVISRAAFYLVPQVKPITAVIIVSAVCLGAERGYIIGAFSAFISNFIFGQGYWTPYQMAALGFIGLVAGLVFKVVRVNKWTLAIIGFVLSFAIYGLIMDLSSVLIMLGDNITLSGALSIYVAGAPFNAAFGISTAVILLIFGEPFVKKVERINTKFALTQ